MRIPSLEPFTGQRNPTSVPSFLINHNPLQRAVTILKAGDGKVRVTVLPARETDPPAEVFDDIDDARSFATGMAVCRGWPVQDLTS